MFDVTFDYRGVVFHCTGFYKEGTSGTTYDQNGDPGSAPDPGEFEITGIYVVGAEDEVNMSTFFEADLWYRTRVVHNDRPSTYQYTPFMDKIREKVLEELTF